jgi:hypothetical protein
MNIVQKGLARIFAKSKQVEKTVKICLKVNGERADKVARQINAACKLQLKKNVCHFDTKMDVVVVDGDLSDIYTYCKHLRFFNQIQTTEIRAALTLGA